ncbi:MAG: AbrB/MazE/SpoVT family DNA-binding domain-containing protein [Patescibacteria group bacterium]|jgi:bifunctional DNA-binding transcriptional regulator/antitoxin component of YhaV-PrlF toxin-antitoxin module|nr:AbrB/MazE/SpoVT family DNA-binding domain-containing protein [Patescibacteria group bacterium]
MKKYSNDNVRKLSKTGSNSYYVVIPKEFIKNLDWQERQKLKVKQIGKKIIIEDWE